MGTNVVKAVLPKPMLNISLQWCGSDYFKKSHISYDASAAPSCSHALRKTLNGLRRHKDNIVLLNFKKMHCYLS